VTDAPRPDLLEAGRHWVTVAHPYPLHLRRAEDWARIVDPEASEEVLLAALLHDFERAIPDPDAGWSVASWGDPDYLRYHQERSAALASAWLADHGATPAARERIGALILHHEEGAPEHDFEVVQAADSLSFLEVNGPEVALWIDSGRVDPADGEAKIRWMRERMLIADPRVLAHADHLLAHCLGAIDGPGRNP